MRAATSIIALLLLAGCGPHEPADGFDGGRDGAAAAADGADGGRGGGARGLCVNDPLTSDRGHFDPVLDPSAWRFDAAGYSQPVPGGPHETLVIGAAADYSFVAATVTPTAAGDAADPGLAGVVLWASRAPAPADGYFCGLDLRGQRLLLGRLSGDAASPTVTTLGWAKPVEVAVGEARAVRLEVRGPNFVSCYADAAPLADSMTSSDGVAVPGGAVGLMTLGVGASFRDATWCRP